MVKSSTDEPIQDEQEMAAAWQKFESDYKISQNYQPHEQIIYMAFEAGFTAHTAKAVERARQEIVTEIDDIADGLNIPSITTWKQGKFIDSPKYNKMGERWKFEQEEREQTLIRPHGGTNNALFQVSGYVDNSVIAEYLEAVGAALNGGQS